MVRNDFVAIADVFGSDIDRNGANKWNAGLCRGLLAR
jgi:hypothetical protein